MGNARLNRLQFPTALDRVASGLLLGLVVLVWAMIAGPFFLARELFSRCDDVRRIHP